MKIEPFFAIIILLVSAGIIFCQPVYPVHTLATLPHDQSAFTEGFLWEFDIELNTDVIYEGAGLYGQSRIQKSYLSDGKIIKKTLIEDSSLFGEGIVKFKDKFYQLTWKSRKGFIYTKDLDFLSQFDFPPQIREGWGLTTDQEFLIMSNGSTFLNFLHPENLTISKTLSVFTLDSSGNPSGISELNELEYIDGLIYINKWRTKFIYVVNATTGETQFILDGHSLSGGSGAREMNGIAYDSIQNRLLVTGKNWHTIYQISYNTNGTEVATTESPRDYSHHNNSLNALLFILFFFGITLLCVAVILFFVYKKYLNQKQVISTSAESDDRDENQNHEMVDIEDD